MRTSGKSSLVDGVYIISLQAVSMTLLISIQHIYMINNHQHHGLKPYLPSCLSSGSESWLAHFFAGGTPARRSHKIERREARTSPAKRFLSTRTQAPSRARGSASSWSHHGKSRDRSPSNARKGQQQRRDSPVDKLHQRLPGMNSITLLLPYRTKVF